MVIDFKKSCIYNYFSMNQSPYGLEDSLGRLISMVYLALKNRLKKNFAQTGCEVTAEQWRVLVNVWFFEGITQSGLGNLLMQEKTGVARMLGGLEKRGLISRVPDKRDKRSKRVYLTETGKSLQKDMLEQATEIISRAEAGIDRGDIDICKKVLREIFENLAD